MSVVTLSLRILYPVHRLLAIHDLALIIPLRSHRALFDLLLFPPSPRRPHHAIANVVPRPDDAPEHRVSFQVQRERQRYGRQCVR